MKDIKSLFLSAKTSGRDSEITAYNEAVNEAYENNPQNYITYLEYIIRSTNGIKTLIPFIEQYGLPITKYDTVMETIDESIAKCNESNITCTDYTDAKEYLENYRKQYVHCFAMYEWYTDHTNDDEYVETYYGTTNGHQNRILAAGMIKKFGESAIPDALITARKFSSMDKLLEFVKSYDSENTRMLSQWMVEACKDINQDSTAFMESAMTPIITAMRNRNNTIYRESVIMGNPDVELEYSQEELDALQDMISFKEYALTWSNEFNESAMDYQREIYDLYSEYSGMILEDVDNSDLKDETDYVPIYAVLQSYSHKETDNRGEKKNIVQKSLASINKAIRMLTGGDKYTHALISLDTDLDEVYSFGSLGFEKASINKDDLWLTTDDCYIAVMFITKEEFQNVKKYLAHMKKVEKETTYAYSNLVRMFAGKPISNNKRLVCSTFTAYVLQAANPKLMHRDYSRMRPEDITILPRAFYVMNFKDRDDFATKKDEFKKKVRQIEKEHIEEIKDYNNHLPRLMLKTQMDKCRTFDKLFDWIASTQAKKMNYKKEV